MNRIDATSTSTDSGPTQADYEPSEWAHADWEIVGEVDETQEFRPMEVKVFKGSGQTFDPMFSDFGGRQQEDAGKRWHLPENLAYDENAIARAQSEEAQREADARTQELEQVRAAAFEEGRRAAIEEAVGANAEKVQHIEDRFSGIFRDLQNQLKDETARMEAQAVEFALEVARKIVDQTVEINPEYIVPVIREAIAQSGSSLIRKIKVSPQDMEFIEFTVLRKQLKEFDGSWDFEADETIRSGCVVETSAAEIDYQLDKAWERIREQVVKVIK